MIATRKRSARLKGLHDLTAKGKNRTCSLGAGEANPADDGLGDDATGCGNVQVRARPSISLGPKEAPGGMGLSAVASKG